MLQAVAGSVGLVAAWLGLRAVRPSSGPEFTVMSTARLTDGLGQAQSAKSNRTVAIQPGWMAAGSQGPAVKSWARASRASMPHLAAVDR